MRTCFACLWWLFGERLAIVQRDMLLQPSKCMQNYHAIVTLHDGDGHGIPWYSECRT